MDIGDLPPYRAAGAVRPSLTVARMSELCRDSVFSVCRRTGCKFRHDITLIETVEAEQASKRRVRSDFVNTLIVTPRLETGRGAANAFLDSPGALSQLGPRHDNDYQHVNAITVFPTTDEILSLRRPHLPAKDSCLGDRYGSWEVTAQRLAALLYRHLRFDSLEPVMDIAYTSMQMMLQHRVKPAAFGQRYRQETATGVPFSLLLDVLPEGVVFVENSGVCVELTFACPMELRGVGFAAQGVCEPGMLICLVYYHRRSKELGASFLQTEHRTSNTDREDQSRAGVYASFADPNDIAKVRELLYACKVASGHDMTFALADCGGVLPAGFVHHLNRLQELSYSEEEESLSKFSPLTAALVQTSQQNSAMKTPKYSRLRGFRWSLDSIKKDPEEDKEHFVLKTDDRDAALKQIKTRTTLDCGQAEALFCNLTRELAFTQGPPGTGKSYLALSTIKVLIESVPARCKPIVVVTQTNHSLDETLEGLIKGGVFDVVRCGTKSQSTLLIERHSVRALGNRRKLSDSEKANKRAAQTGKITKLELGENLAAAWSNNLSWVNRMANLSVDDRPQADRDHPNVAAWNTFASAGGLRDIRTDVRSRERPAPKYEKRADEREWFKALTAAAKCDAIAESHRRYFVALEASRNSFDAIDANTVMGKAVVGMTSTAVAQYKGMLSRLKPSILVIEEASELTEAHTLCTMMPSVEHVIAIGDPRQLRPHVGQKILGMENSKVFRFDESLFERLVTANYPFAKLEVQRRAHPTLARLIQVTDYPFVKSHNRAERRIPVRGMEGRLQWMDHKNPETRAAAGDSVSTKSYENVFEAHYILGLALKLVRFDDYWIGDITVITPYNGQLALITKLLSEVKISSVLTQQDKELLQKREAISRGDLGFEEELDEKISRGEEVEVPLNCIVHAATIDNYQGEEARIVIFSAVRSNKERSIGFLGNENRINVAVSRAQEGFYVIGDAALLGAKSPFWNRIIQVFHRYGRIQDGLMVRCRVHDRGWMASGAKPEAFGCKRCYQEDPENVSVAEGSSISLNREKGKEREKVSGDEEEIETEMIDKPKKRKNRRKKKGKKKKTEDGAEQAQNQ